MLDFDQHAFCDAGCVPELVCTVWHTLLRQVAGSRAWLAAMARMSAELCEGVSAGADDVPCHSAVMRCA